MAVVRWGIVGAGKISFDFCVALKTLPGDEHCIKAIASRSYERSKELADKFDAEKAYGTYDALLQDSEVDIVYIGTLNTTHKELSIKALQHDKHVLCEKPAAMNADDLDEILEVAKSRGNIFMEAVWTRFFPLYDDVQKMIKDHLIGDVMAVQVSFGELLETVERVVNPELGGSALRDIGIYTVNFTDMVFMGERPINITASGVFAESGVDLSGSITFVYDGKRIAQMLYTGNAKVPSDGIIVGTKGKIVIRSPFWCPTSVEVNGVKKDYPLPDTIYPTNFTNSAGLRFEAEHIRQLLLQKKNQSDIMTHDVSRRVIQYLDEISKQMKK